jgi:gliding motility-associated-like protein
VPFLLLIANCFGQLDNGLLLHYELDGDCTDSSPNGNHGTPIDITFIDDQFGNPSSAVLLNGVTSRVDFPNIPELEPDFPMSFAVRTRFDLINGQQIVFATDFSGSTHSGAWLQLASSGDIVVSYGNAQGGFIGSTRHGKVASLAIDAGTWYNVAIIIRGFQDIDIHIDCELIEGSYNGSATSIGYTNGVGNLGRKSANPIAVIPPYFLEGAIDDFWYWDRELTEEEIFGFCEVTEPCLGSLSVPDISGCVNEPIEFLLDLEDENSDILTYFWEFEDGSSSNLSDLVITTSIAGVQDYALTITTENGCEYNASGVFSVSEVLELPEIETEVTLCEGEFFELDAADFSDWTITDSDGDELDVFVTIEAGLYSFTFTSACSVEQIDISIDQITISDFVDFEDQAICTGSDVVIDVPNWESVAAESDIQITLESNASVSYLGDPLAFTFSEDGIYTFVIDGSILNCPFNETFQIEVVSPPKSFAQNDYNICGGDEIDLDFSDLPFDVFDSEGEAVVAALISTGGTYIFTGQNACSSFEEVVLVNETVINPPSFGDFQFLCEGQDTLAIGFNSSDYDYLWDSGSQEPSILVFESGQNEVLVTDTAGICSESFVFQVNSFPFAPSEIFEAPAVEICLEGQTIINFPPQFGPYTFSDTLAGLTYTATETESLSFTYSDGCYTYQKTLFISVESCLCPAWVPNGFSPDEDGVNDFFKPVVDCAVYDYQMLVFNRWGREIFQSNDINTAWRGESANSDFYASTGIYVYLIVFNQELDGLRVPTELTGTVTLMR